MFFVLVVKPLGLVQIAPKHCEEPVTENLTHFRRTVGINYYPVYVYGLDIKGQVDFYMPGEKLWLYVLCLVLQFLKCRYDDVSGKVPSLASLCHHHHHLF